MIELSLPSYVINFDELANAIKDYLQNGVKVDIGSITVSTSNIEDLLTQIRDKIQGVNYTDLINALNDLGIKLDGLSGNLGISGIQKIYGEMLEITASTGTYMIEFTVPKNGRITGITYSQSAWNFQDTWDLKAADNILFTGVRTKEYGENKFFNVFYQVTAGQKIDFVFNNISGSSKILWVDFNILEDEESVSDIPGTNNNPSGNGNTGGGTTTMTDTTKYLRRFVVTDSTDPSYVDPSSLNMDYWTMASESIPNDFWKGRNSLLQMFQNSSTDGSVYTNSVINTITNFHKYLFNLQQDIRKNALVLSDWQDDYSAFISLCNKDVSSGGYGLQSLTTIQKTEIYLTYIFQTVTLIFPSCESLLTADYINEFKKYLPVKRLRVLEWIDFSDVKSNKLVDAFDLDLGNDGDLKTFTSYMNVEPSALDVSISDPSQDEVLNPFFFKLYTDGQAVTGDSVVSVGAFPGDKWEIKKADSSYDTGDAKTMAVRTFLHELGHGIDFQYETINGTKLSNLSEWRDIGGWEHGSASSIPKLKPTKWACDCTAADKEPPISLYGCTLVYEDFAETHSCYCINPGYLQKYYPKRYAFMEKYVKNFSA